VSQSGLSASIRALERELQTPLFVRTTRRVTLTEAGRALYESARTVLAAVDEGVPVPVLSTALYERFGSRDLDDFANRVLSAMRFQFGGHQEKPK
jgi:DNA-binding transcriptional LysR family regulator